MPIISMEDIKVGVILQLGALFLVFVCALQQVGVSIEYS
jgi:hypothetical protein